MTKPFNCANQPGNFEKKASSRCFDWLLHFCLL
jgi:hypothetical protein